MNIRSKIIVGVVVVAVLGGAAALSVTRSRGQGIEVQTGRFQQQMQVELVNDGPVTLLIDSHKQF